MNLNTQFRQIEKAKKMAQIDKYFSDPNLPFVIRSFEKGEMLTSPDKPAEELMIALNGKARIYGIGADAQMAPISTFEPGNLLGDMEFAGITSESHFVEAMEPMTCLSLSLWENRQKLSEDNRFLHYVIGSLADKLEMAARLTPGNVPLEERFMSYLKRHPDQEISGIEQLAIRFHCSRRQLQRVLKQACEDGVLEKTGKGHYRYCL